MNFLTDLNGPRPVNQFQDATDDAVIEARMLRRRLTFWRRAAWLIAGAAGLFLLILWQRAEMHIRDSAAALQRYAQLATEKNLVKSPPKLLPLDWMNLPQDEQSFAPASFALIISNWYAESSDSTPVPLAVSRRPMRKLLSEGRQVLYRVGDRMEVRWVDEDEAAEIYKQALKDVRLE